SGRERVPPAVAVHHAFFSSFHALKARPASTIAPSTSMPAVLADSISVTMLAVSTCADAMPAAVSRPAPTVAALALVLRTNELTLLWFIDAPSGGSRRNAGFHAALLMSF